jgi:hypothetical protein
MAQSIIKSVTPQLFGGAHKAWVNKFNGHLNYGFNILFEDGTVGICGSEKIIYPIQPGTKVKYDITMAPGAIGYKWNSLNNYNTSTDMGSATTKTESGLSCNSVYSRYVWAYYSCGTSVPTTLTQSTMSSPSPPILILSCT